MLRRIAGGESVDPESYMDMTLVEWLPRRWDGPQYSQALGFLSERFEQEHGDRWLRDLLAAGRSDRGIAGLRMLAEAAKANRSDGSGVARKNAEKAAIE